MTSIEPLDKRHQREQFACGEPALDDYLRQQAGQDQRRRLATVYVATLPPALDVIGYYTLSNARVALESLDDELRRRLPYRWLPATLIGRLAVAQGQQGRGIGQSLLLHALRTSLAQSDAIASAFVLVQAKHEAAKRFYQQYGFVAFRDEPLQLYLPMKTVASLRD